MKFIFLQTKPNRKWAIMIKLILDNWLDLAVNNNNYDISPIRNPVRLTF